MKQVLEPDQALGEELDGKDQAASYSGLGQDGQDDVTEKPKPVCKKVRFVPEAEFDCNIVVVTAADVDDDADNGDDDADNGDDDADNGDPNDDKAEFDSNVTIPAADNDDDDDDDEDEDDSDGDGDDASDGRLDELEQEMEEIERNPDMGKR